MRPKLVPVIVYIPESARDDLEKLALLEMSNVSTVGRRLLCGALATRLTAG